MPHRPAIPALALALLLPAFAACATVRTDAADGSASLLTDRPEHAARQECRADARPEVLPTAAELVDEAGFRDAARALWKTSGGAPGYVLFSMRFDRYGLNVRRGVIEHSVPPEVADSLQKLLFAHRRESPAARREWGVRLRVDLGEETALRVGRHEVCRAVPREGGGRLALGSGMTDIREEYSAALGPSTLADQNVVWVRVHLDAAGAVTDARVERGVVRGPWESRLLGYVRTIAFRPALEDGYPVPGEVTIPVRLGR